MLTWGGAHTQMTSAALIAGGEDVTGHSIHSHTHTHGQTAYKWAASTPPERYIYNSWPVLGHIHCCSLRWWWGSQVGQTSLFSIEVCLLWVCFSLKVATGIKIGIGSEHLTEDRLNIQRSSHSNNNDHNKNVSHQGSFGFICPGYRSLWQKVGPFVVWSGEKGQTHYSYLILIISDAEQEIWPLVATNSDQTRLLMSSYSCCNGAKFRL